MIWSWLCHGSAISEGLCHGTYCALFWIVFLFFSQWCLQVWTKGLLASTVKNVFLLVHCSLLVHEILVRKLDIIPHCFLLVLNGYIIGLELSLLWYGVVWWLHVLRHCLFFILCNTYVHAFFWLFQCVGCSFLLTGRNAREQPRLGYTSFHIPIAFSFLVALLGASFVLWQQEWWNNYTSFKLTYIGIYCSNFFTHHCWVSKQTNMELLFG